MAATVTAERNGQKKDEYESTYHNFATPLIGTFLNLPDESVVIKCPSCGLTEMSHVIDDMKWWADETNKCYSRLFFVFCCCFCLKLNLPCHQTDRNHYCKNCGCYFGRSMKHAPLSPRSRRKHVKF